MDYENILKQLKTYYANLLIIQYNGKPKAKATIELLTELAYSNMALMQIRDAFDWRTATDAQLDIIGKWVGVSRAYTQNNTWENTYLSYPAYETESIAYDDAQRGGYSDYSTFNDTIPAGVLTYDDLQSDKQQLDTEEYRTVIGLKIIKNNIVHNQGNIDKAIAEYFAERDADGNIIYDDDGYIANPLVYTTWQPHIITYHYPASLSTIINICLYKNVLPAPTGVKIQTASY